MRELGVGCLIEKFEQLRQHQERWWCEQDRIRRGESGADPAVIALSGVAQRSGAIVLRIGLGLGSLAEGRKVAGACRVGQRLARSGVWRSRRGGPMQLCERWCDDDECTQR